MSASSLHRESTDSLICILFLRIIGKMSEHNGENNWLKCENWSVAF